MSEPAPPVEFHVADAVVAKVARLRARQVPGVVSLRHAAGTVAGDTARVDLTVVTRLGHNVRDLAQAVQREVAAELATYAGVDAVVTVTMADVLLD